MNTRCCRLRKAKAHFSDMPFRGIVKLFEPFISFPKDFGLKNRKRIFTVTRTFWLFVFQVLSPDSSCRKMLLTAIAFFRIRKRISLNTSGFCKARKRFRTKDLFHILETLIKRSSTDIREDRLWFGRHVKVVDGTTCSMPDTEENQKVYPQPDSQKKGCGFPMVRIVAVFSLVNGIILNYKWGAYRESERSLFRTLLKWFHKGDVLLTDRGFAGYVDFASLLFNGVDFVVRACEKNRKYFLLKKRFNRNDRIVQWSKPVAKPGWMDRKQWERIPQSIDLRVITYFIERPGFRTRKVTVLTSLLNQKEIPASAFKDLYLKRWRAELYFKDIKTTMGMDILSCKSPEMIEKEILMYLVSYNLIRLTIYESAVTHNVAMERISFKAAMQAVILLEGLISGKKGSRKVKEIISRLQNPRRPGRREPRAVKRRPKRHQYLTKPRHLFREDPHRGKRPYSLS